MRALHTADWHIGQTLNGWSREREHEVFFARLADVLEEEDIDLLLVAGDIFDNTNPSGESQRLLYRSLAEFKRRRPRLVTVISGGNHDPALRLEAPADLFESLDIHAIGTVRRQAGVLDAREHLVAIPGPNGAPALYVLAIPFLRAADLTGVTFSDTETGLSIEAAARSFHAEIVAAVEQIVGDLPLIATGHLHCTGGIESEGAERRILIGGSHAVPPDIFPPRLDYVALGHLHGPQSLDHKPSELRPRQLLAVYDRPIRRCAVNLEYVLCQIDADDANFSHGCPLLQLVLRHHEFGTSRCRQGRAASTPSPSTELLFSNNF